jgi:hypothetical protein
MDSGVSVLRRGADTVMPETQDSKLGYDDAKLDGLKKQGVI